MTFITLNTFQPIRYHPSTELTGINPKVKPAKYEHSFRLRASSILSIHSLRMNVSHYPKGYSSRYGLLPGTEVTYTYEPCTEITIACPVGDNVLSYLVSEDAETIEHLIALAEQGHDIS